MKLVTAYVRTNRAAHVVRALHEARVHGFTVYFVHGMSGEAETLLYGPRPFEPSNLPDSVKIEVICEEALVDGIVTTVAQAAKTGNPGDGIIAVGDVQKLLRIRDIA
jgi:nitrogen regulatory protein P-II 1